MSYGGPHYGFLARPRAVHPPAAGPDRRRDGRRRGRARLRPHPADARAAHPAREGDLEHHHQPDPARPGGAGAPLAARAAGPARDGGDLHGPRRATPRRGSRSAGSSSCFRTDNIQGVCRRRRTDRAPRRSQAARASGVNPGYPLGRDYPGLDDAPARRRDREAHGRRDRPAGRGARARWPGEADLREVAAGPARPAVPRPDLPVPEVPDGARPQGAAAAPGARRARGGPPLHRALDAATSASTPASTRSARAR